MAASTGVHSYQTDLQYDSGGSVFVTAGEVKNISGPSIEVGTVKLTHLNSPNAAHEKGPGMIEGGKASFTCNFTKADLVILYGFVRVQKTWRIQFPLLSSETTPSRLVFVGHITSYGIEVPEAEGDAPIEVNFEIDVSGKPVFTAGT